MRVRWTNRRPERNRNRFKKKETRTTMEEWEGGNRTWFWGWRRRWIEDDL